MYIYIYVYIYIYIPRYTCPQCYPDEGCPLPPPAAKRRRHRAHAHTPAGMHSAHARIPTHTYACTATYTHMCTHTCTAWCTSSARAARPPARPPRASHRPAVKARRGGLSQCLQLGPVGRLRQRRELGLARVPARQRAAAPSGSGPTLTARRSAARASHARAGAARPTTGNTAATASNAARRRPSAKRGSARGSGAAPAPPRTCKAAGRRRGRTGNPRACTGRATRGASSPSWRRWTCRAPSARAPAAQPWTDVWSNRPKQ
jgi:hypothetical protein